MQKPLPGKARAALFAFVAVLLSLAVWLLLGQKNSPSGPAPSAQGAGEASANGKGDGAVVATNGLSRAPKVSADPGGGSHRLLLRSAAETEQLALRHQRFLRELGLSAAAHPAARKPLAKEAIVRPPGQHHALLVKFGDGLMARADQSGNLVVSAATPDESLQRVIAQHGLSFAASLTAPAEDIAKLEARALANTGSEQPDLAGMLAAIPAKSDPDSIYAAAEALQSLPAVEFVALSSRDEPPPPPVAFDISPTTPSFTRYQTYRGSLGINIDWAWSRYGARGQGVRVTDCEYSFLDSHEDMRGQVSVQPGASSFFFFADKSEDDGYDHGTASLGVLKAAENGYGMTGTVPDASAHFYADRMTDAAGNTQMRHATVAAAIAASSPGDVVLLEMQAGGPNGTQKYVPAEYDQDVWTVVKAGTDAGIHVVAAAGNGAQNLDAPEFAAYRSRGDSGAIIVGAGTAVGRNKANFSTYGSRVNLQGWGDWTVATLGYTNSTPFMDGAALSDVKQRYTKSFAGTSSASPIVTSAAVAVQSVARRVLGRPLNPLEMRELLAVTGSPQGGDTSQWVGPLPDISSALASLLASFGGTNASAVKVPGVVDLAKWNLAGVADGTESVPGESPAQGVTATALTRSEGLVSTGDTGGFYARGWSEPGRYFSFGFNVSAGKRVFPADLMLAIALPYTSGPGDYVLRYSGDNFQSTVKAWTYKQQGAQLVADLSKLGALEGSVEFRIYVASQTDYNGETLTDSGRLGLKNYSDSMRLTGSVEDADGPVISSLNPAKGRAGTEVTIEGRNLGSATKVLFGSASAVPYLGTTNGTLLRVTVPADARTGPVTVVTPQGTATREVFSIVAGASDPAISVDTSPMGNGAFESESGAASASRMFYVGGANLSGHLTVMAPEGYEVSADGTNYAKTVVLASALPWDSASNYRSGHWIDGSTGGCGFGRWQISRSAPSSAAVAGNLIADPASAGITGLGTSGFCLFASPYRSGAKVEASRNLPGPLRVGDTFKFQWAVNLDGDGGRKGFVVYTGGAGATPLINVEQESYPDAIVFGVGTNAADTGIGNKDAGAGPMTWSFTRTAEDVLRVEATGRDGGTNTVFATNVAIVGAPDAFRWYASELEAANSALRYPFYDNLSVNGGFAVASQRISVRLAASAAPGSVAGDIVISGGGAEERRVSVSGVAGATPVPPGYDLWAEAHQLDPSSNPPSADADGDGDSNLLEFALGTDPKSGGLEGLEAMREGEKVLVRFLQVKGLSDPGPTAQVAYVVQATDDLASGEWADAGVGPTLSADQEGLPPGGGYERVEVPVLPAAAKKFFRVKVSFP